MPSVTRRLPRQALGAEACHGNAVAATSALMRASPHGLVGVGGCCPTTSVPVPAVSSTVPRTSGRAWEDSHFPL